MKLSKAIYRDAAKHLSDKRDSYAATSCDVGMCDAIQFATEDRYGYNTWNETSAHQQKMIDWMHPRNNVFMRTDPHPFMSYWGKAWGRTRNSYRTHAFDTETATDCRILALCFMAAIVAAGDE